MAEISSAATDCVALYIPAFSLWQNESRVRYGLLFNDQETTIFNFNGRTSKLLAIQDPNWFPELVATNFHYKAWNLNLSQSEKHKTELPEHLKEEDSSREFAKMGLVVFPLDRSSGWGWGSSRRRTGGRGGGGLFAWGQVEWCMCVFKMYYLWTITKLAERFSAVVRTSGWSTQTPYSPVPPRNFQETTINNNINILSLMV